MKMHRDPINLSTMDQLASQNIDKVEYIQSSSYFMDLKYETVLPVGSVPDREAF